MKVNRRDLIKAGVTVLGTGALAGVAGGQSDEQQFDRYCAFRGPTDARDLLEPEGCAYVYLDEGDGSVYISRQEEDGWTQFAGGDAAEPALIWGAADLDSGTDNGVVHENTANTAYDNVSLIRKGDATAAPLYASDLVAWYPLQESSGAGTAHDFSGNGNDGTIKGATPAGGKSLCGTNTFFFDGTDDIIDLPNIISLDPFTVSAWFTTPGFAGSDLRYIIDMRGDVDFIVGWYETIGPSENLNIWNRDSTPSWHDTGVPVDDGGLHHVSVSHDGSTVTVMIDGVVELTTSGGIIHNSSHSTPAIGDNSKIGTSEWNGTIADVRIYDRALSNSEMGDIYDVFAAPSSHEFVYKGPSVSSSPTASFTSVSIPSAASATLEFLEDTNGDGTVDNSTNPIIMTDGKTDYTASGLAGSGELALRVSLSNTDLTVASTVEVPVEVTG